VYEFDAAGEIQDAVRRASGGTMCRHQEQGPDSLSRAEHSVPQWRCLIIRNPDQFRVEKLEQRSLDTLSPRFEKLRLDR
jgi:hypothetical protein